MEDIQTVVLIEQERAESYLDCDQIVDAAGNRFVVVGTAQPGDNDITWVDVSRYAPSGNITGQWTVRTTETHKIDEVTVTHSGVDLLLLLTTHERIAPRRSIRVESAVIPNVFTNSAGLDQEEGGAGAFTGQQRFADVLPGSTFYTYIEFLASKGAIGGYTCGEPGEPCVPPQNLPYFRPGNPLTRGQICKIIALALDFNPG